MNCIWKRSRIASAIDAGENLPEDLRAHVESCESCRRYFEAQQTAAALLQQSSDPEVPYPEGLNAAIMREIRNAMPERQSRAFPARRTSPWLAPIAFAAIALVAALFLIVRQPDPHQPVLAGHEAPIIEETVATETAPSDYIRTWSVAINQPLDNELESVVADARSAVRFLAVNFLPESDQAEKL